MEKNKNKDKALLIHLEVNQRNEIVLCAVVFVSRWLFFLVAFRGKSFFLHHDTWNGRIFGCCSVDIYCKSGALNIYVMFNPMLYKHHFKLFPILKIKFFLTRKENWKKYKQNKEFYFILFKKSWYAQIECEQNEKKNQTRRCAQVKQIQHFKFAQQMKLRVFLSSVKLTIKKRKNTI